MRRSTAWDFLSPSHTLLEFAEEIVEPGKTSMLDLACGSGRNAIAMAAYGCDVVGVDRDWERLRHLNASKFALLKSCPIRRDAGNIVTVCADLSEVRWPFASESFNIVISVHFVRIALIPRLLCSLRTGGHIYIETFGGHGMNYLDLPSAGEIKAALGDGVHLMYYKERPASRRHAEAVSVKVLARKH